MEKRHFVGYHGTNDTNAKQIIRTNFSMNQMVGWLGTGVYFYDNDFEMAKYWALTRHKGKIPKVVKSNIYIPKEQVLDMTETDSKKLFHEFRRYLLQKELENRQITINVNSNQDLDGKIYNAIAHSKGYKLIRAETYTFQDEERNHGVSPSRVPNSTKLCLKHLSYIINKESV